MPRLALIPVALVAALLVLAGCGGSTISAKEKYKQAFAPLSDEIASTGTKVGVAVSGAATKNDAQVAVDFARLADSAATLAGSLVLLDPPGDLAADHASLVRGLRQEAGKLNRIVDAAVSGDAAAAKSATQAMVAAAAAIRDPRTRIAGKLGISG